MSIKINGVKVRHNGKIYHPGHVIKIIEDSHAKRLVDSGAAFFVEENNSVDPSALLDSFFNADGLKKAAAEVGLQFPGNISKKQLIEQILGENKAQEVLSFAHGNE